jgi:hypothetical protein
MAKTYKNYYIGFYRYEDTKTWVNTRLNEDKEELEKYLNSLQYIDKFSINIKEIELPE